MSHNIIENIPVYLNKILIYNYESYISLKIYLSNKIDFNCLNSTIVHIKV
jgi:hypothetical protein